MRNRRRPQIIRTNRLKRKPSLAPRIILRHRTIASKRRRRALYQRRAKPDVRPPQEPRGPEARPIPASIPEVTLLALNAIPLQKRPQLILKIVLGMVRLLRIDILESAHSKAKPAQSENAPYPAATQTSPTCRRLTLQPFGRRRLNLCEPNPQHWPDDSTGSPNERGRQHHQPEDIRTRSFPEQSWRDTRRHRDRDTQPLPERGYDPSC